MRHEETRPDETQEGMQHGDEMLAGLALRWGVPDQTDRLPTIDEMVSCPPTEEARKVADERTAAVRALPEGTLPEVRRRYEWLASQAIQQLKWAQRRDLETETRRALGPEYADCFCLGQGGRQPNGMRPAIGIRPYGDTYMVAQDEQGQPILSWHDKCPCPDGAAFGERVAIAAEGAIARAIGARVEALAGAAEIPRRYDGLTTEGWREAVRMARGRLTVADRALALIGTWEDLTARGDRRCLLVLAGNLGTGKSALAAILGHTWVNRQRSVLYRSAPALEAGVRTAPYPGQATRVDTPTEADLAEAWLRADLGILDDLGTEPMATDAQAERWRAFLFRILDGRLSATLPTIVTTNLRREGIAGAPGLLERYGSRLTDRLSMPDAAIVAVLATPSLRGTSQELTSFD